MDIQNQLSQAGQLARNLALAINPRRRKKSDESSGGAPAPKTELRVGPDRRAQAVLRAANRPKERVQQGRMTRTAIKNPAVGVQAFKYTEPKTYSNGTISELIFNRFKPGDVTPSYSSKAERKRLNPDRVQTAHSLHKDRLRSAAIKHAMGRQLTDIRPGHDVGASTVQSSNGRNPRGRIYEKLTNGALNFAKGSNRKAVSSKLTKDSWQPYNRSTPVRFNPNSLKDPLKALAQSTIVRATSRLVGGPYAQPALAVDDAVAATTGKRPSKELAKQHTKAQSLLIKDIQKRKKAQAPWVGSGPF